MISPTRRPLATVLACALLLLPFLPVAVCVSSCQAQESEAAATPTKASKKKSPRRATEPQATPSAAAATSPSAETGAKGRKGAGAVAQPSPATPTKKSAKARGGATPSATPAPTPNTTRFRVTADTTPFFKLGPQQPAGPDLALKKDTRVSLVKRGFGYSQIKLDDGMVGYVGNEDIKLLTAEEAANETTLTLNNTGPAGSSAALFGGNVGPSAVRRRGPRSPALPLPPDAQEPSLPLPDFGPTPKPQPTPAFRLNPEG